MKLCPTCGEQADDAAERCAHDDSALIRVKPSAAEREQAMIGRTIDRRYVIEARLGQGGMGTVYVAQQVAVGRRVAIKLLPPAIADDLAAVKRFMQEAKAASTLSHPNSITIHDFGQLEDGLLFLVMELVEGQTLAAVLKAARTLPPDRAVRICGQILSALEDAHARGIVHRDLKPDNVIVSPRPGSPDFVKVLDFGLAKVADADSHENLTQTGQVFGTPAYMSPEQALGERCDLRTDLYAVGVMLYEMLGGRRPFEGDSPVSILVKHINEAPPPLAGQTPGAALPQALVEAARRALQKRREDRFQTAAEMRAALESAVAVLVSAPPMPSLDISVGDAETLAPDSLPPLAAGVSGERRTAPPAQPAPRSLARAAAVVAVLGLAAAGASFATQSPPPASPVPAAAAQAAPMAPATAASPSTAYVPRSAPLQGEATPPGAQAVERALVVSGPVGVSVALAPAAPSAATAPPVAASPPKPSPPATPNPTPPAPRPAPTPKPPAPVTTAPAAGLDDLK